MNALTLAEIFRAANPNVTRKQLKVMRAKLRRAGLTYLDKATRAPYEIDSQSDARTKRTATQAIVTQAAAIIARAA